MRDIAELQRLIEASVFGLQARDNSRAQLERALKAVYGVDTRLIADRSYFVVETKTETAQPQEQASASSAIVGCGGWSRRKTLFGGDQWAGREDALLDPRNDAAKIRAFFVHPDWARRGIGAKILHACEQAALAEGFRRLEMGATLTGVPFYRAKGYVEVEETSVPMGDGLCLPIVRMEKIINLIPGTPEVSKE